MSPRGLAFAAIGLLAPAAVAEGPPRPRITRVAHIALYVRDIESSRAYYKGILGYAEP